MGEAVAALHMGGTRVAVKGGVYRKVVVQCGTCVFIYTEVYSISLSVNFCIVLTFHTMEKNLLLKNQWNVSRVKRSFMCYLTP